MDFVSAVKYMKHGYRARRASWHPKSYVKKGVLNELEDYHEMSSYRIGPDETGKTVTTKHTYMSGGWNNDLDIDDFLADDWELITTGIRKEFSKHENGIEYNDDTDWDNYVPPKGGWFSDDDEDE